MPSFLFKINATQHLILPLVDGIYFVYNCNFITHRQLYDPKEGNTTEKITTFHHMAMKIYVIISVRCLVRLIIQIKNNYI